MKKFPIAIFISLIATGNLATAQPNTAGSETRTGSSAAGPANDATARGEDVASPTVGTGSTRSKGWAGSSATGGVSGPNDGAVTSSGGSGAEGSSGSSGGSGGSGTEETYGSSGSSSANPAWEGIGSTGGATGTGESIGTSGDSAQSGGADTSGDSGNGGSEGGNAPGEAANEREPTGTSTREPGGSR